MFSWDMIVLLFSAFFSLYLVFGMLVIARKRYLFLLEWSFCFFKGNSISPFQHSNRSFHLFDSMAYWGARFPFLEQIRSASLLWSLFLFRFPQLFLLL
jgi:hypothetical protein